MKYIRTKDGKVFPNDIVTHELVKDICDAGYFRTLQKGSLVRIGETWCNFYGRWTSIYDLDGKCYDIRPDEVEKVTRKLEQADTIEELCDEFVVWVGKECKAILPNYENAKMSYYNLTEIYGAIWTDKGLIYVAKMNEKGELELL